MATSKQQDLEALRARVDELTEDVDRRTLRTQAQVTKRAASAVKQLGGCLLIDAKWNADLDIYLDNMPFEDGYFTVNEAQHKRTCLADDTPRMSEAQRLLFFESLSGRDRDDILAQNRRNEEAAEALRLDPNHVEPGHVQQHIKWFRGENERPRTFREDSDLDDYDDFDHDAAEDEDDYMRLRSSVEEQEGNRIIVESRGPRWPRAMFQEIESAMKYYIIRQREIYQHGSGGWGWA